MTWTGVHKGTYEYISRENLNGEKERPRLTKSYSAFKAIIIAEQWVSEFLLKSNEQIHTRKK